MARLFRWVDQHALELVRFAQRLIQIPSVNPRAARPRGEGGDPCPEGAACRQRYMVDALETLWRAGEAAGMAVSRHPPWAGHVETGAGRELVGVLCHVDVVPPGPGWTVDPFGGEIREGRLYGRGAIDNKGPTAAAFFALRALHESGLPLRRRVRLIVGGDEEGDWRCMEHYFQWEERPRFGFAPDGLFPVVCGEKGILTVNLVLPWPEDEGLLVITPATEPVPAGRGGRRQGFLPVPGSPEHLARHGSPAAAAVARFLAERLGDTTGRSWGLAMRDSISGSLQVEVEELAVEAGRVYVSLLIRYPVTVHPRSLVETVARQVAQVGGAVAAVTDRPPHYVSPASSLVRTLQRVFSAHTGLPPTPLVVGASSYARFLEEGVVFGPVFPGEARMAHRPDEFITVNSLLRCTRLYAHALYELINADE